MKRHTLLILLGYFGLTVLLTWPVALHLTDAIPGDGFDGWQNYWNLWWVKQALLVEGTNPFFTDYLYPPTGVSLLFHTLNIFNGLWTLPLQLNFGLAIAYNSVVITSYVMAGYGGYLLSLHTLTRFSPAGSRSLRLAAFVGGLVFTMSPFHMAHLLGHMQVFSMTWPVFYVLWLLRTLKPWATTDAPSPHLWRDIILCAFFLFLATLVALYHTLYLLIFTAVTLLWTIIYRWRLITQNSSPKIHHSSFIIRPFLVVLAIGLLFGLVSSPLLLPMMRDASARPDLETGLVQNITLSADLLAYVTPSEMHPLWGEWARSIADNFSTTTSERLIFAGFVPLLLAGYIIIRAWASPIVRFWTVMIAVYFVLSLGPFLHINGQIVTIGGWQLPLPYLLLYYTVPFLDLTRSLSRYNLMFMLGLGVLVSLALARLVNPLPATRPVRFATRSPYRITFLVVALICFEFLAVPYPISPINIPQFYFDIAAQPDRFIIAELPMNWDRPTPLLHQTVHGRPLLTAYTSRDNPLELAWRTPVFQQWRNLGPDIIDQPLDRVAPTIFYDFNLRYIVLDYWQMPPGPERDATERWVAAALPGIAPVYEDGRLKVFASPPKEETAPYLSLGEGWGDRQMQDNGFVTRTLGGAEPPIAELFVHHPTGPSLTLELTAAGPRETQLAVYAEDRLLDTLVVNDSQTVYTIDLPLFEADLIKLRLEPSDGPLVVSRVSLTMTK